MPHFKSAFPSKSLQSSDLLTPIEVVIKMIQTENVGLGADTEHKLVAHFREAVKPLVLNLTRAEAIAAIAGDDDTDGWVGRRLRLSRGRTTYKGKAVSCIVVEPPASAGQPSAGESHNEAPSKVEVF